MKKSKNKFKIFLIFLFPILLLAITLTTFTIPALSKSDNKNQENIKTTPIETLTTFTNLGTISYSNQTNDFAELLKERFYILNTSFSQGSIDIQTTITSQSKETEIIPSDSNPQKLEGNVLIKFEFKISNKKEVI